jgi:hypothetical protein
MAIDLVGNVQGPGDFAQVLLNSRGDVSCLRPYKGDDDRSYITVNDEGGEPVAQLTANDTAVLRYDEWKQIDEVVMKNARLPMRFVNDLRSSGLSYSLPNGMAHTMLQWQRQSEGGRAQINMNPAVQVESDRVTFDVLSLPLPIIHSGWSFDIRDIMTSRNKGLGIDVTMAEQCAHKCAEEAERLALGTYGTYAFGGSTIYGLTNWPSRQTKVLTAPTASGWTPVVLIRELLSMIQMAQDELFFGPYKMYCSPAWTQYMDDDFSEAKGSNTLRQRIGQIDSLAAPTTLHYLDGFQIVLVHQASSLIREVVGMDWTTVQWSSMGGMLQHFMVMGMFVPQLRVAMDGYSGIVHGATA